MGDIMLWGNTKIGPGMGEKHQEIGKVLIVHTLSRELFAPCRKHQGDGGKSDKQGRDEGTESEPESPDPTFCAWCRHYLGCHRAFVFAGRVWAAGYKIGRPVVRAHSNHLYNHDVNVSHEATAVQPDPKIHP